MDGLRSMGPDLRKSSARAGLVGFLVLFLALVQEHQLQESISLVEQKTRMLSGLQDEYQDLELQRQGYDRWSDPWESIRQQGFLNEQPSSGWIDFLDMLERSGGVVVTRMDFLKTYPLSAQSSALDESGLFNWQVSTISLGLRLRHEGYLMLFLQNLKARFGVRMLPEKCQMFPRQDATTNDHTSALGLQLDCQLYWFNNKRGYVE